MGLITKNELNKDVLEYVEKSNYVYEEDPNAVSVVVTQLNNGKNILSSSFNRNTDDVIILNKNQNGDLYERIGFDNNNNLTFKSAYGLFLLFKNTKGKIKFINNYYLEKGKTNVELSPENRLYANDFLMVYRNKHLVDNSKYYISSDKKSIVFNSPKSEGSYIDIIVFPANMKNENGETIKFTQYNATVKNNSSIDLNDYLTYNKNSIYLVYSFNGKYFINDYINTKCVTDCVSQSSYTADELTRGSKVAIIEIANANSLIVTRQNKRPLADDDSYNLPIDNYDIANDFLFIFENGERIVLDYNIQNKNIFKPTNYSASYEIYNFKNSSKFKDIAQYDYKLQKDTTLIETKISEYDPARELLLIFRNDVLLVNDKNNKIYDIINDKITNKVHIAFANKIEQGNYIHIIKINRCHFVCPVIRYKCDDVAYEHRGDILPEDYKIKNKDIVFVFRDGKLLNSSESLLLSYTNIKNYVNNYYRKGIIKQGDVIDIVIIGYDLQHHNCHCKRSIGERSLNAEILSNIKYLEERGKKQASAVEEISTNYVVDLMTLTYLGNQLTKLTKTHGPYDAELNGGYHEIVGKDGFDPTAGTEITGDYDASYGGVETGFDDDSFIDHGYDGTGDHGYVTDSDHGYVTDDDHGYVTDGDRGYVTDDDGRICISDDDDSHGYVTSNGYNREMEGDDSFIHGHYNK